MHKNARGFTIVELLIVIVVIAILASMTVVAYNGIQNRAKDVARVQDARSIEKALELYKIQTSAGNYPVGQAASWELSYNYPSTFINALVTSNVVARVPVDAVNTSSGGYYKYYRYTVGPSGMYGCDPARGDFYVLAVWKPGGGTSAQSPGFSCPGRNWANEGWYVTGGYQNG